MCEMLIVYLDYTKCWTTIMKTNGYKGEGDKLGKGTNSVRDFMAYRLVSSVLKTASRRTGIPFFSKQGLSPCA